MAVLTIPQTSIQYVQQQIIYTVGGVAADPTGFPVGLVFVPQPSYGPPPDPSSFDAATWETDSNPVTYWAQILVGTTSNGGVGILPKGAYVLAYQVTTPIEIPVGWGVSVLIT